MLNNFRVIVFSSILVVISSTSLQAQDGRGSRGGSPRRVVSDYRVQYAPVYIEPCKPAVEVGMTFTPATERSSSARIAVLAPEDAQVWFDGNRSDSQKGMRVFSTTPMASGQKARVCVKIARAGNTRELQLDMQPGDAVMIDLRSLP